MKVTKAQAQANREHVVRTASTLFRERGYDGVGVVDLMAAAGFTHGGFYKQFQSKAELMAESAACGIAQTVELSEGMSAADFVKAMAATKADLVLGHYEFDADRGSKPEGLNFVFIRNKPDGTLEVIQ